MLAIISDLHLADGTSGETLRESAFRVLRKRICDLAFDASWRRNGTGSRYQPIEKMTLVLLGDVFDFTRSRTWLTKGNERPWDDLDSPALIRRVKAINSASLAENRASLEILKSLTEGAVTLPKTEDRDSQDRIPVEVDIYYMVGNHDWFYFVPGEDYTAIRTEVVEAMGLRNEPNEPFPHDPDESSATAAALRRIFEAHGVFARHGDIYDPFNYEKEHGRAYSSLGDAWVVELLNRFDLEVKKHLADELPEETILGFRELDNVKPYAVIPGWINGLLDRTVSDRSTKDQVMQIWNDLASDFLKLDFVRSKDKPWRLDLVDVLQAGLWLGQRISLETLGQLTLKFYQRVGSGEKSYVRNTLREAAYKNGSAEFIVYGHTHEHEVVPLNVRRDLRQLYVNAGTWRRVYGLVKHKPESLEFYGYNVMTFLTFFQGDERQGHRFETWSGSQGVSSS